MRFLVLLSVVLIISCANTAKKLNLISVGMSKSEVISVLGEPLETKASEDIEYMIYNLRQSPGAGTQAACAGAAPNTLGLVYLAKGCQYSDSDYFVRFKEGKVNAYGRIGDFDSTQKPETTININKTFKEIK